jgi:heat shock protein HslJ
MRRTLLLTVGALLLTVGCGDGAAPSSNSLSGSAWEMTHVRDGGELAAADPTTIVTAVFSEGVVSGWDGCNNYQFAASIDGDSVAFEDLAITGRACRDSTAERQADAFITAMRSAARLALSEGTLELTDDGGDVQLRFRSADELPLTHIDWRLEGYAAASGGMTSALAGAPVSLAFTDDGTLRGIAGCNDYQADYEVEDDVVTIRSIVSTESACSEPDGVMAHEAAYLDTLELVLSFETTLTTLELLDADRNLLAEFRFAGRAR